MPQPVVHAQLCHNRGPPTHQRILLPLQGRPVRLGGPLQQLQRLDRIPAGAHLSPGAAAGRRQEHTAG